VVLHSVNRTAFRRNHGRFGPGLVQCHPRLDKLDFQSHPLLELRHANL
jgi:hypothetical protein